RTRRQAGRRSAASGRNHGQPQRGSLRPASPDGQLRGTHRHRGAGDPRVRPGRVSRGRRRHQSRVTAGHRRRHPRRPAQPGRCPGSALPALPEPHGGHAVTAPSTPAAPGAHLPDHPEFLWRTPEPKKTYDVVIVGGGGHGLATAPYLAKNHGITNVAVLERGWLAGGNMARNTTLIRSNYLWDESSRIYEHALKLWGGLEDDLEYPILFSQRGVLNLAHSLQDVRDSVRRVEANKLNGIDAQWIDPDEVKKLCPI